MTPLFIRLFDAIVKLHAKNLGRSLYKSFVHHVRWRGICLRATYLQGTNQKFPIITLFSKMTYFLAPYHLMPMSLHFFVVYILFNQKSYKGVCNAKVVGKNMATKRHKAYIPLQKLSAKTYHTCERLVLTKTNLNLCKICVLLTTSHTNKCDNMMHIIPRQ